MIARPTGTHEVVPDVTATKVPGDHMVKGQLTTSQPAVLAGVVVADEHFAAGQTHLRPRPPD